MDRLKWERNYDGLDDEDMHKDSKYKRFLTSVKNNNGEHFFADVEGIDKDYVNVCVWRKGGLGQTERTSTTFASAKAWAKRELERQYKR